MTAGIYTLGCRVNQYESEAIAQTLAGRGVLICQPDEACDAYIINTCAVTAESARKARQLIRRAHTQNPDAFILVTGCAAQTETQTIAELPGVDYICGSSNKMSCVNALMDLFAAGRKNPVPLIRVPDGSTAEFERMSLSGFGRTRAYLKIEDGCENRCAYCIIPRARGRVRSKPEEEILHEVQDLVNAGYREIVLTGIEIAAYGKDLSGADLISLIRKLDRVDGLERIRLGSLDPSYADERFVGMAAECRHLCAHFHLSLQSGCDATLRAMRRRYNTEKAARNMERLRACMPEVCFSADLIVGFPGETDEHFADTCEFVKQARLLHGHVFPYSRREGTEAANLPGQIPEQIKKERAKALSAICDGSRKKILHSQIGKTAQVLFERSDGSYAVGHTDNFIETAVESSADLRGICTNVRLIGVRGQKALAKISKM